MARQAWRRRKAERVKARGAEAGVGYDEPGAFYAPDARNHVHSNRAGDTYEPLRGENI